MFGRRPYNSNRIRPVQTDVRSKRKAAKMPKLKAFTKGKTARLGK